MIRKLRLRFVAAAMLSLALVLAVILGIIATLNYRGIVSDVDGILQLLRRTDGRLPEPTETFAWDEAGMRYQSPELPYEIRFFSVLLDEAGSAASFDLERIYAVGEEEADACVREALRLERPSGFVDTYRFLRYTAQDGERVIFLDCGRILSWHRTLLLTGAAIAALGLLAVLGLLTLLSGRIVKPLSEGYEKQRRFITDAGHELRTPLAIIDADAEVIEMETGRSEWLDDIRSQTRRLSALTGALTDLSRMDEQTQLQMVELSASDVMCEAAESFRAPARARGLELVLRVEPALRLRASERALRQLTGILLDNAVKYATGGDVVLTLERQGPRRAPERGERGRDGLAGDAAQHVRALLPGGRVPQRRGGIRPGAVHRALDRAGAPGTDHGLVARGACAGRQRRAAGLSGKERTGGVRSDAARLRAVRRGSPGA